jgi:hypothetical protein
MMAIEGRNLRMTDEQLAVRMWDWTFLNDAFPPLKYGHRMRIGDVDGMVEIGGHFLFIEVKAAGAKYPTAQRIAYERLVQLGRGRVTVIYLYGDYETNQVVEWERIGYTVKNEMFIKKYQGNNDDFLALVSRWNEYARARTVPKLRRANAV